ncbi:MAG TPA: hypothetical protein VKG23_12940 [Thermoanaerobaculia bacterium]|nr:hypothetical protein [Thermoanaerobaculia bacterium]
MRRRALLPSLLLAAAAAMLPGAASALEEVSLLTSDGTLHDVRSGTALELGVVDNSIPPTAYLIDWTSKAQDGTVTMAILPDTVSYFAKYGLDLVYDDQTSTLLLLWTENISAYSQIRIGVLSNGAWTNSMLVPSSGISQAANPQMLVTHQNVTYLDQTGAPQTKTSSILSIVWWEWGQTAKARYASLFLDEGDFSPSAMTISDVPALIGVSGPTPTAGIPSGAYLFPSLQADGLSGSILIAYADMHDQRERVLRVDFPIDWGNPYSPTSMNWKRRHIPIVGVAMDGPVARQAPEVADTRDGVHTIIGRGYRPTLSWGDTAGDALQYTRLDTTDWGPVRSIAISDQMTYDQATTLIVAMAQRN